MELKGIDISEWQGKLSISDFKKIKKSGVNFVIIRCGYTTYNKSKLKYVDRYFENNYKLCKEIGLPIGAYYYSCATNIEEAKSEANFVISLLKGKKFEYPIAFDTEDTHDINNPNYVNTSQATIGKNKLTEVTKTFCDLLEKNNYYVSIYASTSWFNNNLILSNLKRYDKWIAQWSKTVNFSEKYGIWQYSSTGSVNGINGNIDLNYSYKDYPNIMITKGLNGFTKEIEKPVEVYKIIIINYLYDNKSILPSVNKKLLLNTRYSFTSPKIEGYIADKDIVSGVITKDEVINVNYTKESVDNSSDNVDSPNNTVDIPNDNQNTDIVKENIFVSIFKAIINFIKKLFKIE